MTAPDRKTVLVIRRPGQCSWCSCRTPSEAATAWRQAERVQQGHRIFEARWDGTTKDVTDEVLERVKR